LTRRVLWQSPVIVLLSVLLLPVAASQTPPAADQPPPAPTPATTSPPGSPAQPPAATSGKPAPKRSSAAARLCRSPQAAVQTFVDNLEPDSYSPVRAASCFERVEAKLGTPPVLAEQLKKVLDARGLELSPDELPADADYQDEQGRARVQPLPRTLKEVELVAKGGRWVFPAATVEQIPRLYREAYPLGHDDLHEVMPAWLRVGLLGVELWQLAGVLLLLLVSYALQKVVVVALGNYLKRLFGRLNVRLIQQVSQVVSAPLGGLASALVLAIGFPILQFPIGVNRIASTAIGLLAAFSVVWLAYRLVDLLGDRMAEKAARSTTKMDDQLVPLVRKSLKVVVILIGGLFILQNLSVDVASLLAGLGLGGLAFAMAAKDTVANLFGSVMIFIDKPFQIGDMVKLDGGVEGTVEEVGFRSTRLRTLYNSLITLPNAKVADASVDNLGARQYRRYSTTLGLTYDTPPEKVQAFCEGVRAIIRAVPGMRQDYYMVEFQGFGASQLDILVYCFMVAPNWEEELRTRTHLNLEILRLAQDLGVEFAFPTQTVHVQEQQEEDVRRQRELQPQLAPDQLGEVIQAFGPGGARTRPRGVDLGVRFDPLPPAPPPPASAPPPAETPGA